MATGHKLHFFDARDLSQLGDSSIDLVVTSPPYPMIEMWDELFFQLNPAASDYFQAGDCYSAFDSMHAELKKVWTELFRVMKPGAFTCINIGDATRTINGKFQLFPNHSRILHQFIELGFDVLPLILWRKQTNAPNKFMGSGMLPAGAYVTLEHEYILIFRKGGKRVFSSEAEKNKRRESAIFWEERNTWYSDIWDFKGTRQDTGNPDKKLRQRSAAFPFMLPFRLINMFSVMGDTVLDPFLGTGTTMFAAMASCRNSIGYEVEPLFESHVNRTVSNDLPALNRFNEQRVNDHLQFVKKYTHENKPLKYKNDFYGFPVMTKQETKLRLPVMKEIVKKHDNVYRVEYMPEESIKRMVEDMDGSLPFSFPVEGKEAQLKIDFQVWGAE